MKKIMFAVGVYAVLIALSIGFTGILVKMVCWAFEITFSWKYVIGIWAVAFLLKGIFERGSK